MRLTQLPMRQCVRRRQALLWAPFLGLLLFVGSLVITAAYTMVSLIERQANKAQMATTTVVHCAGHRFTMYWSIGRAMYTRYSLFVTVGYGCEAFLLLNHGKC